MTSYTNVLSKLLKTTVCVLKESSRVNVVKKFEKCTELQSKNIVISWKQLLELTPKNQATECVRYRSGTRQTYITGVAPFAIQPELLRFSLHNYEPELVARIRLATTKTPNCELRDPMFELYNKNLGKRKIIKIGPDISIKKILDDYFMGDFSQDKYDEENNETSNKEDMLADIENIKKENNTTVRKMLIDARLGQGKYKKELIKVENKCRFTNLSEPTFLIASHMKPWRECENDERLDPYNGLLLSPQYDLLFDKFLITFEDNGVLLLSENLGQDIKREWNLIQPEHAPFHKKQLPYLNYHRNQFFEKQKIQKKLMTSQ